MSFVVIPADALRTKLAQAGFARMNPEASSGEEIWSFIHKQSPHYMVKIYTTIPAGRANARGCGEDAIRVVAVRYDRFNGKWVGLYKATKVLRTGTVEKVLERVIERAREAYQACNEHLKRASS